MKKDEELELVAKILFSTVLIMAPIGLLAGILIYFFDEKTPKNELRYLVRWSCFCLCGFISAFWISRTQWGWFKKKP